jgi:hypothetical protein
MTMPMDSEDLQTEFERLERALARGVAGVPPGALRQRVMSGVQAELHRPAAHNGWWTLAAMVWAAFLWANLSLSAVNRTSFSPPEPLQRAEQVAARINQALPEISAQEARRQALLLDVGAALIPSPQVTSAWPTLHETPAGLSGG